MATTPLFDTLLLTGAAGTLGRALAPSLAPLTRKLVLSDLLVPLAATDAPDGAVKIPCDLANRASVRKLLDGVQAVVHLGGVSVEKPFEAVLEANIRGLFHLYEAARLAGTKRIVFASSNHVTGCYETQRTIGPEDPPRPDGYYGLSKLYGEGMASLYHDRWGIETVCLRIGSATPEPVDRRMLSTWLSLPDLARLVTASLTAPHVGFLVTYGMSANTRGWWNTQDAWKRLGFTPQDNAEAFAPKVQHLQLPAGTPMARLQGGAFLGVGPFDNA